MNNIINLIESILIPFRIININYYLYLYIGKTNLDKELNIGISNSLWDGHLACLSDIDWISNRWLTRH